MLSLDVGLSVVGRLLSVPPRHSLTPGVRVDTWRLLAQQSYPSHNRPSVQGGVTLTSGRGLPATQPRRLRRRDCLIVRAGAA